MIKSWPALPTPVILLCNEDEYKFMLKANLIVTFAKIDRL